MGFAVDQGKFFIVDIIRVQIATIVPTEVLGDLNKVGLEQLGLRQENKVRGVKIDVV